MKNRNADNYYFGVYLNHIRHNPKKGKRAACSRRSHSAGIKKEKIVNIQERFEAKKRRSEENE